MDIYKTIYQGDFLWPYIVPTYERPPLPPKEIKKPLFIKEKSILERKLCQCDRHSWSPHFRRAVHLLQKENAYRDAMIATAHQRTVLENEIIGHPCSDADDVIASLYEISYAKQNFPITGFRAVHADHDDPVSTPIAMMRPTITSSYRDPTNFHEEAFKIPTTASPAALTLELAGISQLNV
uniref:Uncharacterized protein n=1 Tax=Rhodnius prolixus TaxID=13249 RepID=T1HHP9_RHOPR